MAARASFGTVESGIVQFNTLITGDDLAGWADEPNIVVTPIPGSDPPITEVEVVNRQGPSSVTWRLYFHSRAEYQAMRAKITTVDTLTVFDAMQSHDGDPVTVEGKAFVVLPHTLLFSLGRPSTRRSGVIEAEATWLRQLDPSTGLPVAFA